MKLTIKLMTALCAGIILFAACKKKKDDTTTTPTVTKTKKDYLTDGKWQFTSFVIVAHIVNTSTTTPFDTTITIDEYTTMDACEKDDFTIFATSGKYIEDEGATKCYPSAAQTDSSSNWSLSSDFTKLTFTDASSSPQVFDVTELTSGNFVWTSKEEEVSGTQKTTSTITIKGKNIK